MARPSHYQVAPREDLTSRQREVLALMAKGYTNAQIAESLGVTLDGAKFHVSEILARFGVASREEAVEAWRQGRRPLARLRALAGLFLAKKVLVAGGAIAAVAAAGVGIAVFVAQRGDSSVRSEPPTVADVLQALQVPGKVVHTELEIRVPGAEPQLQILRSWYSPDEHAGRVESGDGQDPEPDHVQLTTADRHVSYSGAENRFDEFPPRPAPPGAPDAAIQAIPHVGSLLEGDTVEFSGEEIRDGERVFRFVVTETIEEGDASEAELGTVFQTTIFLRTSDLLLAGLESETRNPAGDVENAISAEVRRSELIDRDALPAELFDPAPLQDTHVDLAETLVIAGQQQFPTFWLGERLDTEWRDPRGNGSDHQEIVMAGVPEVPGTWQTRNGEVFLAYGPPDIPSLTLIEIRQGVAPFEPIDPERLAAMEAAGNVEPLEGADGYIYVEYFPGGTCDFAAAQLPGAAEKVGCRFAETGRWGAVLTREGTVIHIMAAPKFDGADPATSKDTNPFNNREAMLDLVEQLQPLP